MDTRANLLQQMVWVSVGWLRVGRERNNGTLLASRLSFCLTQRPRCTLGWWWFTAPLPLTPLISFLGVSTRGFFLVRLHPITTFLPSTGGWRRAFRKLSWVKQNQSCRTSVLPATHVSVIITLQLHMPIINSGGGKFPCREVRWSFHSMPYTGEPCHVTTLDGGNYFD